jgi:hypothetical protein
MLQRTVARISGEQSRIETGTKRSLDIAAKDDALHLCAEAFADRFGVFHLGEPSTTRIEIIGRNGRTSAVRSIALPRTRCSVLRAHKEGAR